VCDCEVGKLPQFFLQDGDKVLIQLDDVDVLGFLYEVLSQRADARPNLNHRIRRLNFGCLHNPLRRRVVNQKILPKAFAW